MVQFPLRLPKSKALARKTNESSTENSLQCGEPRVLFCFPFCCRVVVVVVVVVSLVAFCFVAVAAAVFVFAQP